MKRRREEGSDPAQANDDDVCTVGIGAVSIACHGIGSSSGKN